MENKNTCGECKWFMLNSDGICRSNEGEENANNDCCSFFEPKVITSGDKIRQMSNEGIAAFVCGVLNDRKEETFLSVLDLLNAPAVCVKQNENDDTQTDLCTADNTESEVEGGERSESDHYLCLRGMRF